MHRGYMKRSYSDSQYALGSTDDEHERLIRQARWLAPHTEKCFREAGIKSGQRVVDLGSGVGDVALLLAALVGSTGEVVGVERDERSIARSRERVVEAGLHNVTFTQSDVTQLPTGKPFDAAVGRYILMFVPDPASVLRSLSRLLRPGGILAFQEPHLDLFLEATRPFPLWSACASLMEDVFRRSGANARIGPELPQVFQNAGLPTPLTRTDTLVGADEWMPDIFNSLRPQIKQFNLATERLGEMNTLTQRLYAEISAAKAKTPLPSLVSAWSRNQ